MAIVELPVDIVNSRASGSFVPANRGLRSSWANSFYIPPTTTAATRYLSNFYDPGTPPFFGYGAVTSGAITTDKIGLNYLGNVTGIQQVYVIDQSGNGAVTALAAQVSSLNPTFPAGSLPLAVVVLDAVQRIQQVIDFRPSGLSSAPNLGGGMTESVADPTLRVNFANNYAVPRTYALSAQIPQDLSLPASGFFVGSGAVVLSGNVISTPTTYFSSAAKGGQLAINAITQIFVSPSTGQLATRTPQTSGLFLPGCLPICEATTDSIGLVRSLVDFRTSYI